MIEGKQFSWEEVSKHNSNDDIWIIVDGKVYDITKWLLIHPGGKEALLLAAGRDCTNLFESYHPMSDKPSQIINKYEIGYVNSSEHPKYVIKSEFYSELKLKVREYFKKTNQDPQLSVGIMTRMALVYSLVIITYFLTYRVITNFYICSIFSVLYGIALSLFSLHMMHDACHLSVTHSPLVWKLMGSTFDLFTGASFYAWSHQHVIGHHLYTNIRNADPDLGEGEIDFRIVTPYQPREWYHKYQHIYAPILYCLYTIKYRLQDHETFLKLKNGSIRVSPPSKFDYTSFIIGKIMYIIFRFYLPYQTHSLINVLFYFFLTEIIIGWYLALGFQVSHVAEDVKFYGTPEKPNEPSSINEDWAQLQIKTTQDYSHNSIICTFLSGSLNYQVVHHLFPSIDQEYYPQIAPIVKEHCEKYNITYHIKPTFYDALMSHINYLYKMGNDPTYIRKPLIISKDD